MLLPCWSCIKPGPADSSDLPFYSMWFLRISRPRAADSLLSLLSLQLVLLIPTCSLGQHGFCIRPSPGSSQVCNNPERGLIQIGMVQVVSLDWAQATGCGQMCPGWRIFKPWVCMCSSLWPLHWPVLLERAFATSLSPPVTFCGCLLLHPPSSSARRLHAYRCGRRKPASCVYE